MYKLFVVPTILLAIFLTHCGLASEFNFGSIPEEVVEETLYEFLNGEDIKNLSFTCKLQYNLCKRNISSLSKKAIRRIEIDNLSCDHRWCSCRYINLCKANLYKLGDSFVRVLIPTNFTKHQIKEAETLDPCFRTLAGVFGVVNEIAILPVSILSIPWMIHNHLEIKKYKKLIELIEKSYAGDTEFLNDLHRGIQKKFPNGPLNSLDTTELAKLIQIIDKVDRSKKNEFWNYNSRSELIDRLPNFAEEIALENEKKILKPCLYRTIE